MRNRPTLTTVIRRVGEFNTSLIARLKLPKKIDYNKIATRKKNRLESSTRPPCYMPQILAFYSSLVTLKFSFRNFFKTRVLLKIFNAEFPYKRSYFEPLCFSARMAAKTVTRPRFRERQMLFKVSRTAKSVSKVDKHWSI